MIQGHVTVIHEGGMVASPLSTGNPAEVLDTNTGGTARSENTVAPEGLGLARRSVKVIVVVSCMDGETC